MKCEKLRGRWGVWCMGYKAVEVSVHANTRVRKCCYESNIIQCKWSGKIFSPLMARSHSTGIGSGQVQGMELAQKGTMGLLVFQVLVQFATHCSQSHSQFCSWSQSRVLWTYIMYLVSRESVNDQRKTSGLKKGNGPHVPQCDNILHYFLHFWLL